MSQSNLILDVNNIVYRNFFVALHSKKGLDDEELHFNTAISYELILNGLSKFHSKFGSDKLVLAFDTPNSWRKIYTKEDPNRISKNIYKDGRLKSLTESQKAKLAKFSKSVEEFYEVMKSHTNLIVLKEELLEADDLIAGYVQKYKDEQHIIVSTDKDFLQLLTNSNVQIADPESLKFRNLEDFDNDPVYFMYQKCFRGDKGDNVQNAFPKLRETRIKKAYTGDKFEFENLMKNTFSVEVLKDGKVEKYNYITEDIFKENKLLMDLTLQPQDIRELMDLSIEDAMLTRNKFSMVNFLKFLGKYNMDNIVQNIDKYTHLLAGKTKRLSS